MARLMATATCTAFSGVLESSGERVGQRVLLERVGFLAELSQTLTAALVASRWDEDSLDVLAAGVDERGEKLPSKGWMALRRLNWPQNVASPAGVYVPDRVRRGVAEYAARTLRLALRRRTIVTAVLATWPAGPGRRTEAEWAALRALLPAGVSGAEIRNRTRQIRAYVTGHGCLPAGLCALEDPPQVAPQVLLAAMDRQQVTLTRADATTAWLRVKLPLPRPKSLESTGTHRVLETLTPRRTAPVCSRPARTEPAPAGASGTLPEERRGKPPNPGPGISGADTGLRGRAPGNVG
ncbi:MAG: hypothetical protein JF621_04945 [Streptomyces turgidiscabies]|nr:hypothetical protein [Streptomyces turgidiscabies]